MDAVVGALDQTGLAPIGEARLVATGWESHVWHCDTRGGPVAVRVFVPQVPPDRAAAEAVMMRLLEHAGYPAPLVLDFEPDPSALGAPYLVMDFIPGGTLADSSRSDREQAKTTASLLAELHELPVESFRQVNPDPLEYLEPALSPIVGDVVGLNPVVDWLLSRLPDIERHQTVAHLDFHPRNILLDDDGEAWVIDWTSARVTDPRVDTSWSRMLAEMYSSRAYAQAFTEEYERLRGPESDSDFFEVLAGVRRIGDVLWFISPEGSAMTTGEVHGDLASLAVPVEWIRRHTGLAVAEAEAVLDSLE